MTSRRSQMPNCWPDSLVSYLNYLIIIILNFFETHKDIKGDKIDDEAVKLLQELKSKTGGMVAPSRSFSYDVKGKLVGLGPTAQVILPFISSSHFILSFHPLYV